MLVIAAIQTDRQPLAIQTDREAGLVLSFLPTLPVLHFPVLPSYAEPFCLCPSPLEVAAYIFNHVSSSSWFTE